MNKRITFRSLLTESFLPFVIFLILVFIFLNYVDSIINKYSEKVVTINLDAGSDERERESSLAVVKLDSSKYSKGENELVSRINSNINKGNYSRVISLINGSSEGFKNIIDTPIALAFSYYKVGLPEKSLGVLNKIKDRGNPVVNFYYGLVYSSNKKDFKKAGQYYLKYIEDNPNSYEGNSNLGLLYYKNANYNEAAQYFKHASENSSGNRKSAALYRLALCYLKTQKNDIAISRLNESIRLNPSNIKARIKRAGILYINNRQLGIKEYRKVIALDKSYSYGYYIIGRYFFESGKSIRAIKMLRDGLSVSPREDELQSYLGFIYLSLDEFKNSRDVYEDLVKEYSGNKLYHFNLARSYFGLEQYDKAISEYKNALSLDNKYYKTAVNLGVTYSKIDDYANAVKYYKAAIKMKPDSALIYYNLGILHNRQNKYNEAIPFFKKAIKIDSGYSEAFFNLGFIYNQKGNKAKSVEYYEKAIKADSKYILPYMNMSILYKKYGETEKAIEVLNRGIRATGSNRLSAMVADINYKTKRYDKALNIYNDILKSEKNNTDALLGISWVYYRKKEYDKCIENIKRFIYYKPTDAESRYLLMITLYRAGKYAESFENLKIVENLKKGYRRTEYYRRKILKKLAK